VQIGLFDPGLQFIEERYSGEVIHFAEPEVSGQNVACYNEVGISNFNIAIPIDSIGLSMEQQSLVIDIHFGEIRGEEMVLYGEDDDFFDVCPSFETNFNSFSLNQGRLLVETIPALTEDGFDINIIGDPTVTGVLTTDIDSVPDSLINSFIEDKILESIQTLLVERVPSIASTVLQPSLFAGQVGDIALDVELTAIETSNTALLVGLEVDAGWLGDGCPVSGVSELPGGRSPSIDFGTGEGAAIGVGITEQQINHLFQGAWEDGLLCFDEGPLASVAETIEEAIEGTIDNGEVSIQFTRTPVFALDGERANLALNGVNLAMTGDVGGESVTLFHLEADLTMGAEVQVEHDISSFVLDLTHVTLDVIDFQANALLKDDADVEQRMITFLEGWAVDTLASRIDDVPIYGNLFHISDLFLRVTDISIEPGAIVVMGSLYNSDDPEVDREAPDTSATIQAATSSNIQVKWEAEDNNHGPFAYSWRMDQGEWSDWTADESGTISTPETGPHELEVRARDAWLNTDETPTSILFMVSAPPTNNEKGCQCAASPSGWSSIWWLTVAGLVGTRRRRE
jgi:MYXO-CTERM domain-containing protein